MYISIRAFPEDNHILVHYIISVWWFHLLYRLGHYAIRLGEVENFLLITNNIMNFGYTYAKCRLKNPPDIFCKISHIGRIMAHIPSRLSWTLALQGRD